jgi:hypothetical protein
VSTPGPYCGWKDQVNWNNFTSSGLEPEFLVCSIVPQPTTLPRTPPERKYSEIKTAVSYQKREMSGLKNVTREVTRLPWGMCTQMSHNMKIKEAQRKLHRNIPVSFIYASYCSRQSSALSLPYPACFAREFIATPASRVCPFANSSFHDRPRHSSLLSYFFDKRNQVLHMSIEEDSSRVKSSERGGQPCGSQQPSQWYP